MTGKLKPDQYKCLFELKNYEKALEKAEKAHSIHPKSLELSNLLIILYRKLGDKKKESKTMELSSELAQSQLENLLHWGDVYMEMVK